MFGLIIVLALLGSAIASGLGYISVWWILPAIFMEASWGLATGPMYDYVYRANVEGRLSVMPRMIATRMMLLSIPTAIIFGIASLFS